MRFHLLCLLLLISPLTLAVKASIQVVATNTTFTDRAAAFGPQLVDTGILGFLVEPQQDVTGCTVVEKPCQDWIALLRRGGCSFITKVRNMQQSGAIAVAVGDPDHPNRWITMYAPGDTSDVTIPSVFLAQAEYQSLLQLSHASSSNLLVLMQLDEFITWPLIDVLVIVIISPAIMMLVIYISWRIRLRQKRQRDLAPVDVVTRLTVKKFSREKIRENEREECVICLDDYLEGDELRVLPCQHDFHTLCVDAWLTTQKKFCPICKRDITCSNICSTSEATPLLSET